ncbi:pentapeptide repeat-containing protein [Caulobacter sp. SSI4214]|uniref:pentapeptide repeat-containing protein n=1 Tax=Caulobacter sp. SSI4214 TaxID=2575739 RepID=UPI00143C7083|nr:pentapeptide repeat-containing protein [Caulobacter sp. SSI4214]
MKPIALIAALLALGCASAAAAQNAGQIASVRNGANCPRCNLFQADLANLELKNKNLAGARLRQADFSAAIMNRTRFTGGDLRDVNAYGAVLTGASFAHADLTNASFVGAYLQGANFAGARLAGVNFSGAEMDRAIGLTQGQLNQACGDGSTALPRGLSLPRCR